jgi:predicted MFS family arabinose efflux permease
MQRPWWKIGALDLVNFSLADVRGVFGPYLGVFLVTQQHWNQAAVGFIATIGGLVGLVVHAPWGALIDAARCKRTLIVAGLAVLALGAMALARRLGRNAAWDHAGNVTIALVAGVVGYWLSQRAVFFLVPVCAVIAAVAVLSIPASAIDHARARGLEPSDDRENGTRQAESERQLSGVHVLLECRSLVVFAGCAALFHFANAAMSPLVGQKLALAYKGQETALMSACVIAAQAVMLLMALLVGARAEQWGRKPLLLAAFAVLPIRGVLFTLSNDRSWLVTVQLLDGVGNGLFGALMPLVLNDLMRGTGRYSIAAGWVATIQGIGAALSHSVAGGIVVTAGYDVAFLTLAAIACTAFATCLVGMPETRRCDSFHARLRVRATGWCLGAITAGNRRRRGDHAPQPRPSVAGQS